MHFSPKHSITTIILSDCPSVMYVYCDSIR